MRRLLACALMATAIANAPVSFAATEAQSAPNQMICMSAATKGAVAGRTFTIPVPQEQVATMEARGFAQKPCAAGGAAKLANYREKICELAAKAPPPVQTRFRETYGATPAELCGMANGIAVQ